MAYFPDSFLQDLKDRCTVEEVVAHYVELKRAGANLVGLCPFHREKTPSFTVSPDKQIFHCFGCSAGGDVFRFIMRIENVDFVEAVTLLAKRAGMTLPESGETSDELHKKRKRMMDMHRHAARFFYDTLTQPEGQSGLAYLRRRRLTDATIRKYGLGFAPDSWDALTRRLTGLGYEKPEIVEAGLGILGKSKGVYDRFRNRVMFPIINIRGEVIAFGGRVMDDSTPKYLNSPETLIFSKSKNLFSLNLAKGAASEEGMILAEGYMDVLALHQAGFVNSVASLGTALTFDQAKLISRFTRRVTIAYDSDAAGQAATQKAIDVLKRAEMEIRVLKIEGGKDPDEYIKTYGADRFALLLKGSGDDVSYRIEGLRRGVDLTDIPQKTKFLTQLVEILAGVQSPIEQELYIQKAAKEFDISPQALEAELKNNRKKKKRGFDAETKKTALTNLLPHAGEKVAGGKEKRGQKAEEMLLALLFEDPSVFDRIKDRLSGEDFSHEGSRAAFMWMKELWERNEPPCLPAGGQQMDEGLLSALTRAIGRDYEFSDKGAAAAELTETIRAESFREKARIQNSEDMEEMVRWYNQVKNKKSR